MFRRLESSLPPDFIFPSDLKGLGYFITDKDEIRMINDPERPFHYHASKNQRFVEMQKEAMNGEFNQAYRQCSSRQNLISSESIRQIVISRLLSKGLEFLNLPLGTASCQPHVPILTSKDLVSCKTLVVYIGESHQDLGIFAGRIISQETINRGSAVSLVESILSSQLLGNQPTGIVLANPGQLSWYRRGRKTLSWQSWNAIPRQSAVGAPLEFTDKNKIPRNEDYRAHVACLFEEVLLPRARDGVRIFVIGAGDSGTATFDYLQANWQGMWKDNIEALVTTGYNVVQTLEFCDQDFAAWWGRRGRAYLLSDQSTLTPLQGRSRLGCNVYASGENVYLECIMTKAHVSILDYFKFVLMHPGYENTPQDLEDVGDDGYKSGEEETGQWSWGWGQNYGEDIEARSQDLGEDGSKKVAHQEKEIEACESSEAGLESAKGGHGIGQQETVADNCQPVHDISVNLDYLDLGKVTSGTDLLSSRPVSSHEHDKSIAAKHTDTGYAAAHEMQPESNKRPAGADKAEAGSGTRSSTCRVPHSSVYPRRERDTTGLGGLEEQVDSQRSFSMQKYSVLMGPKPAGSGSTSSDSSMIPLPLSPMETITEELNDCNNPSSSSSQELNLSFPPDKNTAPASDGERRLHSGDEAGMSVEKQAANNKKPGSPLALNHECKTELGGVQS